MRRAGLIAGVALATLALSACLLQSPYENDPSDGGVPKAQVLAALEAAPGVASASYRLEDWESPGEGGLFASSGKDIHLSLAIDDGYRIADPAGFLDAAFRAAWAVNDGFSPKGRVWIQLDGGLDIDADWGPALLEVFGDEATSADSPGRGPATRVVAGGDGPPTALGERILRVGGYDLATVLGRWPADEPGDVAPFLEPGIPDGIELPAITGPSLWWSDRSGDDGCWIASWTWQHSREFGGSYDGVVTATLFVEGVPDVTVEKTPGGDEQGFARFCDPGAPGRDAVVTVAILAPATDQFLGAAVESLSPDVGDDEE